MAKDDACESAGICRYCGKEFMGWIHQARYCSTKHKELARKQRLKERKDSRKKFIESVGGIYP